MQASLTNEFISAWVALDLCLQCKWSPASANVLLTRVVILAKSFQLYFVSNVHHRHHISPWKPSVSLTTANKWRPWTTFDTLLTRSSFRMVNEASHSRGSSFRSVLTRWRWQMSESINWNVKFASEGRREWATTVPGTVLDTNEM